MPNLVKLDHEGLAQVLLLPTLATVVHNEAQNIADTIPGLVPSGTDVLVNDYVTDRVATSVSIADPLGKLYQARDGAMTKAAAANGHRIYQKGERR